MGSLLCTLKTTILRSSWDLEHRWTRSNPWGEGGNQNWCLKSASKLARGRDQFYLIKNFSRGTPWYSYAQVWLDVWWKSKGFALLPDEKALTKHSDFVEGPDTDVLLDGLDVTFGDLERGKPNQLQISRHFTINVQKYIKQPILCLKYIAKITAHFDT